MLAGTKQAAVHGLSPCLCSFATSYLDFNVNDVKNCIPWYFLNIFLNGDEIDCHPSSMIHLSRSMSCHPPSVPHRGHPFRSYCNPYHTSNHFRPRSISWHLCRTSIHCQTWSSPGSDPSLLPMHLWMQSSSGCNPVGCSHLFPTVHNCSSIVDIRHFSYATTTSLQEMGTNLHSSMSETQCPSWIY